MDASGEHDVASYLVFAVLQFIALFRYPDVVAWKQLSAWFYVLFQATVLGAGLYGWLAARHARRTLQEGTGAMKVSEHAR